MGIILFRIDDRLIHGQVVEGWLNHIDIDVILLANNMVSEDIMQKTLMEMAVPDDVIIKIDNLENIIKIYKSKTYEKSKILLLVSSPKDAYELIDAGLVANSINVGGLHYTDGKIQILEFLSVDEEDCKYFHLIADKKIKIEGSPLATSEKVDILKAICRYENIKGSDCK